MQKRIRAKQAGTKQTESKRAAARISQAEQSPRAKQSKPKIIVSVVLIVLFLAGALTVYLGTMMPLGSLNMGMNISGSGYFFSHNLMFNDVMKTSTNFRSQSWSENLNYELADDGYPKEIIATHYDVRAVLLYNNIYTGDYLFLYDGDGDFSFSGGTEVLETQPNKVLLRFTDPDRTAGGAGQRWLTVTRSNRENHVRNFRLIPKEFDGKESEMPLFRKDFLDGLKRMHVIRFMDATATNGSGQVHWKDRPQVDDFTFDRGLPWEYLVEICNTLKIDGWFCVPHKASDAYIQNLAALLREKLDKNRTVYIEYSNEIWNTGFAQANWILANAPDAADSYVSRDLAALDDKLDYAPSVKTAYMMARSFRIFESEFSGKDRKRLVTVGAIHSNNWINYTKSTIQYWKDNDSMPDAIAGAGYFGYETSSWNDAALPQSVIPRNEASELNGYFHNQWSQNPTAITADDILDAVDTIWDYTIAPGVCASVAAIAESGARYFVYEGGQHMQPHNQGNWAYNQAVYDAQISPRMYDLYQRNFQLHIELGCELFMNFSYVSARESQYGSWGVLENLSDIYKKDLKTVAPKYQAIIDVNKRNGLFC